MMAMYVEPFIIIDIDISDDTYTIFTDEEIVKQIEKVNTRYYKKLRTEEEIAVAENKLKDAIAEYEERRSNG